MRAYQDVGLARSGQELKIPEREGIELLFFIAVLFVSREWVLKFTVEIISDILGVFIRIRKLQHETQELTHDVFNPSLPEIQARIQSTATQRGSRFGREGYMSITFADFETKKQQLVL